jgi:lipopolysaccharide/colanic/teichoic acid biosynthesis glycosyltransferase
MQKPKNLLLGKIFYKPSLGRVLIDVLAWVLSVGIMLTWRASAQKVYVYDYFVLFTYIFVYWCVISYFLRKYKKTEQYNFFKDFFIITVVAAIVFGSIYYGIVFNFIDFKIYSSNTAVNTATSITVFNYIFIFIYLGYWYATNMDEVLPQTKPRIETNVLKPPHKLDKEVIDTLKAAIMEVSNDKTLDVISQNIDISSSNTKLMATTILTNFTIIQKFRYDAIINITKINSIRGINLFFNIINEKLPDNGLFCCCFGSIEQFNQKIHQNYPPIIRNIVETYFFITKRFLPKIFITNRLWFDITGGKKRIFSDIEVLGRLYYCGFEVISQYKSDDLNWIIAKRFSAPQKLINKRYGLIIKLPRVCKDKKLLPIYKMRTMHSYSEYIQKYFFEQQGTDDIGKIKDDIRITDWGKILRKFWIDELPMVVNLVKGDIKIVGVRPLSKANFDIYPTYLQDKRTLSKPGLIPPMYADLPKTKREFYESEERYLDKYFKKPLLTDIEYFFKAIYNILFKKARSH